MLRRDSTFRCSNFNSQSALVRSVRFRAKPSPHSLVSRSARVHSQITLGASVSLLPGSVELAAAVIQHESRPELNIPGVLNQLI